LHEPAEAVVPFDEAVTVPEVIGDAGARQAPAQDDDGVVLRQRSLQRSGEKYRRDAGIVKTGPRGGGNLLALPEGGWYSGGRCPHARSCSRPPAEEADSMPFKIDLGDIKSQMESAMRRAMPAYFVEILRWMFTMVMIFGSILCGI